MISTFLQIQADTLSQATAEVAQNTPLNTEVSVLEFIFKGGFFLNFELDDDYTKNALFEYFFLISLEIIENMHVVI